MHSTHQVNIQLHTIRSRIIALVVFLFVIISCGTATVLYFASGLREALNRTIKEELPIVKLTVLVDMSHDGIRAVVGDAVFAALRGDREAAEAAAQEMKSMGAEMLERLDGAREKSSDSALQQQLDRAREAVVRYTDLGQKVADRAVTGDFDGSMQLHETFMESFEFLEGLLGQLGDDVEKQVAAVTVESESLSRASQLYGGLSLLVAALVGGLLSAWSVRSIKRSLDDQVAQLGHQARSVSALSANLAKVSDSLRSEANNLSNESADSAAVGAELDSMIGHARQTAQQVHETAQSVLEVATEGNKTIEVLEHSMMALKEGTRALESILELMTDIQGKISVVNDIAFETKLLAFNAAIEAERAGEHGRGFSVVAAEVGRLAAMSDESAQLINSRVGDSAKQIRRIVDESVQKIESGYQSAKDTRESFLSIRMSLEKLQSQISSVHKSTEQGAAAAIQMTRSTHQVKGDAHKALELATAIAESTVELSSAFEKMEHATDQISLLASGTLVDQEKVPRVQSDDRLAA